LAGTGRDCVGAPYNARRRSGECSRDERRTAGRTALSAKLQSSVCELSGGSSGEAGLNGPSGAVDEVLDGPDVVDVVGVTTRVCCARNETSQFM
jgi:hypothetical protein